MKQPPQLRILPIVPQNIQVRRKHPCPHTPVHPLRNHPQRLGLRQRIQRHPQQLRPRILHLCVTLWSFCVTLWSLCVTLWSSSVGRGAVLMASIRCSHRALRHGCTSPEPAAGEARDFSHPFAPRPVAIRPYNASFHKKNRGTDNPKCTTPPTPANCI